ncbi:hypothetical protein [Moraxella sp. ZY200743]|uniref:hypothetical protein n=1 Tax=Moraxella sp. ZY200743 TaxID=2911970 RepID=UPI003D7E2490
MNFLSNLGYQENIEQEKDVLGGNYKVPESGIYSAIIKHAYTSQSQSGAGAINFEFDLDGVIFRETLYVTNRQGNNFYEKNGERNYLPSFLNADAIALFASTKPLAEQKIQPKVIKVYNFEQKKEVPTEVPMLVDLLGKEVKLGIIKEKLFKQVKDNNGNYVDGDEIIKRASISKVFSAKDNRTTSEVRAGKEAEFYKNWLDKWEGQIKDSTTTNKSSTPTTAGVKKSGLFG